MAESRRFQRATPCKFCENPAQYECQNCDDPLCTSCKTSHEREKPHHKYVLYSQKAQTICTTHNGHKYIYWCEVCKEACCTKCAITIHKGHSMIDIEDAICTKRDQIRINLDGPFKERLKEWQSLRKEARGMTKEFISHIQKMKDDLIVQGARIHGVVDENLAKVRSELQEIGKTTLQLLQTQEQDVENGCEEIERIFKIAEEYKDSYDIRILSESVLELSNIAALPVLYRHSNLSYNPGQIKDQTIQSMIGLLAKESLNTDHSIKIEHTVPKLTHLPQSSQNSTALLSKPVVVSSFNPDYDNPYIACTASSGLAWVRTGDKHLQLMDLHGAVKDNICTDFIFSDITVTPQGDVLFSDYRNRRIMVASKIATSWRIRTLYSMEYQPSGICCRRNGNVVVTSPFEYHQVIQYSKDGNIVHEYDRNLFSYANRVAVNNVNDYLYVCDLTKQKVLCFGKEKRLINEYTVSDGVSFDPEDASTDTSSRVLVTDMKNNKIHVFDKDGKFIQYLQPSELMEPRYIDVDSEGRAWIGEFRGKVKVVKYQ